MNNQEVHDVVVNNLNAFITRPNDAGEYIPEDNVSYLITQIKCCITELGYTDQQACDMIDGCFNAIDIELEVIEDNIRTAKN